MRTALKISILMGGGDPDMFFVPEFTTPDVEGVTFGGFWAGRYIASQPGAFNAAGGDRPAVADNADPGTTQAQSKRHKPTWRYINLLNARRACANLGPGYHLMTRFEWVSLAHWCKMQGVYPRGNNRNTNPPADYSVTTETALLDLACYARDSEWYASLTGSGPVTWNHNGRVDGVSDLNGNMWEWNDGLLMQATTGYPYVLASTQVSLARSPYGKSTAVAAGSLTDSNKAWTADEFLDATAHTYLYDSAGTLHLVKSASVANNATQIFLNATGTTPAAGPYTILKLVEIDITAGYTNDGQISGLRTGELAAFGIPSATAGGTTYGQDGYWFDKRALRAPLVGGGWNGSYYAGVWALAFGYSPTYSDYTIGFRLARAI